MRRWGAVAALVLAACGADRPSDEPVAKAPVAPPVPLSKQELVLKARLRGLPPAPSRDLIVKARAFPDAHDELEATVTLSGDALQVVVPAHGVDAAGAVWIVAYVGNDASGTLVFVDSFHGEQDLGVVAIGKAAPVLVAGHVKSPMGGPAPGAWTCVVVPGAGGDIAFPDFGVQSSDAGAFVIHGDVRPRDKAVRVGTIGDWFMASPAAFSRGSTSVELVATNTVDAKGEVALPAGATWDELIVDVSLASGSLGDAGLVGATELRRTGCGIQFVAAGTYELKRLPPGDYALNLSLRDPPVSLARARTSVCLASEAFKLPRLAASAAIGHARVRVAGVDGRPLPGARLWAREASRRPRFREVALGADGVANVVFVDDSVDLVACAPETDYATATVRAGAEQKLTPFPAKATQVTVNLPDGAVRAVDGARLSVRLSWLASLVTAESALDFGGAELDARKLDGVNVEFPATGGAVATTPRPGWYLVSLLAEKGPAKAERVVGPLRVTDAGPQVFFVSVSADAIRSLLDAVARRYR